MTRKPKTVLPPDLDLDAARTPPGAAERPAFLDQQAQPPTISAPAPAAGGLKERAVATTLYLLPADHRRLRVLAIERNVSMQTLLLDAIDLLLERVGQPLVERWETRRKER